MSMTKAQSLPGSWSREKVLRQLGNLAANVAVGRSKVADRAATLAVLESVIARVEASS